VTRTEVAAITSPGFTGGSPAPPAAAGAAPSAIGASAIGASIFAISVPLIASCNSDAR